MIFLKKKKKFKTKGGFTLTIETSTGVFAELKIYPDNTDFEVDIHFYRKKSNNKLNNETKKPTK